MRLYRMDPDAPDAEAIAEAAAILRNGGLGAFPTETVYGLGANAFDPAAIERLIRVKRRPKGNPFSLLIGGTEWLAELTREIPPQAQEAIVRYFPGPLTVVLQKSSQVPDSVTAGRPTVGIRMPDHPVALMLIRRAGVPVAAPSANLSGDPPATDAEMVARIFGEEIDFILDSGPVRLGVPSTVVDFTREEPLILRQGALSADELGI